MIAERSAPTLVAWLRRSTDDAVVGAYLVLSSSAITGWLAWSCSCPRACMPALAASWAQIVLAIGGGAFLVRVATRRRASTAASLVAVTTGVAAWLGADRFHIALFGSHLDRQRLWLLYEALRSHAIRADVGLLVAFFAAAGLLAVLLRALVVALTYLPTSAPLVERAARLRVPVAVTLALVATVIGGSTQGDALRAALPWGPRAAEVQRPTAAAEDADSPFDDGAEQRMFARLERDRDRLVTGPLSARRRPSIVLVHAESVRFDMLRDDVMPNTLRLSRACISPTHHYSTSNNTGSSMFGILTGLPVSYYDLARRGGAKPLPLEILKRLGYSLSAYYSAYLSTYDGLCDLFFKGVVDHVIEEPNVRADVADAAIVEGYVDGLSKRDSLVPTFDYIVLESSHYDYAYPPEFERFVPTATLGLGIRDGMIRREGINAELRPRGPFIRNRYQNSILWTDTLIQKISAAWAARGQEAILVITGDHGEAFWEHGTFGHGLSLSDEQVRVPLVMCIPGTSTTRYTYSSHADIFPTIFDFMGLEAPDVPFMAGKSLLRYDSSRNVALFGYGLTGSQSDERLGVAGDGLKLVFPNRPPFSTISSFRDGDIEIQAPISADIAARAADLKVRAVQARILR